MAAKALMRSVSILILAIAVLSTPPTFAQDPHEGHAPGGVLELGRYVGHVKLDETGEKVAVTMDAFVVQPDDRRQFPKLNAIFRLQLGGFGTSEYVTETFEDIRYDFNHGMLSLDEPANDMVISAEVHVMRRTTIVGYVWIRSAATSGTLFLEYQSDEPGTGSSTGDDTPFMPLLSGQYEGTCGTKRMALQISTGKGLTSSTTHARGLHGYGIVARLAEADSAICGDQWCVVRNFSEGRYNYFSGKLTLSEPNGATACEVRGGRIQCRLRTLDETIPCDLRRTDVTTLPFKSFPRLYGVRPTTEQRQPLPESEAPSHAALMAALRGTFNGWLHHEGTDRYQPFRLAVVPSISTDNPHNENEIVVTATAVHHFGRSLSGDFWPQQFERRSFYLVRGFTLESPDSDGFLQITDWRRGFIRGVWYSHAYGRVGTIELVKGPLPPLDASAKVVAPLGGDYRSPSIGESPNVYWWINPIVPSQPVGRDQTTLGFGGLMHLTGGLNIRINIADGSYDLYTGAVSWLTAERDRPRMVTGHFDDQGRLMLLFPGAPIWGVGLPRHQYVHFPSVGSLLE